jgi:cytochrome d ubiquinol oxidase subunit II
MTVITLIFLPIVLIYQGWSYWIFRKRISDEQKNLTY